MGNNASLRVRALAVVNGKVLGYNSPTDTLKTDITVETCQCQNNVGKITKICLVDNQGTERDCTTDLSYEDHTPDYVVVKGSIQATASYTVAKIRAYSNNKLYFETSYSVALNQNDVLDVTYQISVTVSCSLSGSVGQDHCVYAGMANELMRRFIGASDTTICLKKAHLMFYNQNEGNYVSGVDIDLSLSCDTDTFQTYGQGSGTSQLDFDAEYLMYDNGANPPVEMIEQWFTQKLPIYNGTQVNVSYTLSVQ